MYKDFVLSNTVCPDLSDPSNGSVTMNGSRMGDSAVYSCDDEFELVGDEMRTCMRYSEWSGEAPVCWINPGNELVIILGMHAQ